MNKVEGEGSLGSEEVPVSGVYSVWWISEC